MIHNFGKPRDLKNNLIFDVIHIKGIDYCPIEIIKGLTDKGQFQLWGASGGELPVYKTISFTRIKINILS